MVTPFVLTRHYRTPPLGASAHEHHGLFIAGPLSGTGGTLISVDGVLTGGGTLGILGSDEVLLPTA